jgi:23S rRNA (uracil1939-C5)-methyltransferase
VAAVGFRARGTHEVVAVSGCAIADPLLVEALPLARALAEIEPTLAEIELLADDRGFLFVRGWSSATLPVDAAPLLERMRELAERSGRAGSCAAIEIAGLRVEGVVGRGGLGPSWISRAGDPVQQIDLGEGTLLRVPVGTFTQVSLAMNRLLVREVIERVAPRPGLRVLDLYAGAGNFSVPLARHGASIVAVEANPEATLAARANAQRLGLDAPDQIAIVTGDVTDILDDMESARSFDVVLLDPPRTGARSAIAVIAQIRAPRVVYVSCDVASFARDARALVEAGYRFESYQVVDLTPETYRAEGIGGFRLT